VQKQPPHSPGPTSPLPPQSMSPNTTPNKPLPQAPDLMIPARQASRAKLAREEKLRRRSMDVLREQEERVKASQAQSGRKSSMAEKVRSVTKRGSGQALSSKTKSPKPSVTKSSAPSKMTSPVTSPRIVGPGPTTRSPAQVDPRQRSSPKVPSDQLSGAIELPAEVPRDSPTVQETARKGGLHIHLGSKHKHKEQGSRSPSSKSLNIFRRSPHWPKPSAEAAEADRLEITSPKQAKTSPSAQEMQQVETQLAPPSTTPPQRQSPDPGLPSPPALNFSPTVEPKSYTALPDVLATAQKATTVRASLRVSMPPAAPEPEDTPKATPAQPAEPVQTKVSLAEKASVDPTSQPEADDSKHASVQSSLGEPGPEIPGHDPVQAYGEQKAATQDDEKTPTTTTRPELKIPTATSSSAAQEVKRESVDTPLTSATMRSYSDFYKLPPQQASATPPPITPEGSIINQTIPSSVVSSVSHSKNASVEETETGTKPPAGKAEPEEKLSSPRSTPRKNVMAEKKSTNPKDLRLKPRNKDLQNQSELLDLIASTPPHSPIHTRGSSDGSTLNAVGMKPSSSRILAPPEEAPPPPAPGGRSMVIPDYAAAGAFEGERKPRRGSAMSTGGWKKVFAGSGGSATATGPGNAMGGMGFAGTKMDDEKIPMSANLLSGQGNDVLWYKGMGKDGLWVSGA
jgi:hypothetical protein